MSDLNRNPNDSFLAQGLLVLVAVLFDSSNAHAEQSRMAKYLAPFFIIFNRISLSGKDES